MEEGRPLNTLRAAVPSPRSSCMWTFQRNSSRSDEDERIDCDGIMGRPCCQPSAVGTKRRSHDEDQQQAQGAKKKKKKKARSAASFLTEYTAEDIERFNQDKAHTDKLLDEAAGFLAAGIVPDLQPLPSLLDLEEDISNGGGGGGQTTPPDRVSDAMIKVLRSFTRTRFHPISERFLRDPYLFDEAAAEGIREDDRFISKVYAFVQELAAEVLEEHDAKVSLDSNADDRTIKLSEPSAP